MDVIFNILLYHRGIKWAQFSIKYILTQFFDILQWFFFQKSKIDIKYRCLVDQFYVMLIFEKQVQMHLIFQVVRGKVEIILEQR